MVNIVEIDQLIKRLNKAKCDFWYHKPNESVEKEKIHYGHTIERVLREMLKSIVIVDNWGRDPLEQILKAIENVALKALTGIVRDIKGITIVGITQHYVLKAKAFDQMIEILKMLTHYWRSRDEFSLGLLVKALEYLCQGKNPFLDIKEEMEAEIKAKGSDYQLSSNAFYIELPNDDPIAEPIELPEKAITITRIRQENAVQCPICKKYTFHLYYDKKEFQLTMYCLECDNLQNFAVVRAEE